ncbi:MAG: hypothetical protein ABSE79_04785 [Terriglobia bacterium]
MPLYENARDVIRTNLGRIRNKNKVHIVPIGTLTPVQLATINAYRLKQGLRPIEEEVVFVGGHIYKSRIIGDGYTIEDVIDQISSAMDCAAIVLVGARMTTTENPNPRLDRYGNLVRDRAVFECSARHPLPELFSVVPKGDNIKPTKQKGHP